MFYWQQLRFKRIMDKKLWEENISTAYNVYLRSITWYLVHVFGLGVLDGREKHTFDAFDRVTSCSHACAACTHSTRAENWVLVCRKPLLARVVRSQQVLLHPDSLLLLLKNLVLDDPDEILHPTPRVRLHTRVQAWQHLQLLLFGATHLQELFLRVHLQREPPARGKHLTLNNETKPSIWHSFKTVEEFLP